MSERKKLYELNAILIDALKIVRTANEVPEFVISKTKGLEVKHLIESLAEVEDEFKLFEIMAQGDSKSKVSEDDELERKKDFYEFIKDSENALAKVMKPSFKLSMEKYIQINELANKVQEVLGKLLLCEQKINGELVEEKEPKKFI